MIQKRGNQEGQYTHGKRLLLFGNQGNKHLNINQIPFQFHQVGKETTNIRMTTLMLNGELWAFSWIAGGRID